MITKIFILSDGVWMFRFRFRFLQVPDISDISGQESRYIYRLSCSLTSSTSTAINYSYMDNTQTNNFKLTDLHLKHKQASSKAIIWDDDDVICGGYVAAEVWWPQNNLYAMSTQGTPTPPQSNPTAIADISHYRYYRRWRTFFNPAYFLAERT